MFGTFEKRPLDLKVLIPDQSSSDGDLERRAVEILEERLGRENQRRDGVELSQLREMIDTAFVDAADELRIAATAAAA